MHFDALRCIACAYITALGTSMQGILIPEMHASVVPLVAHAAASELLSAFGGLR